MKKLLLAVLLLGACDQVNHYHEHTYYSVTRVGLDVDTSLSYCEDDVLPLSTVCGDVFPSNDIFMLGGSWCGEENAGEAYAATTSEDIELCFICLPTGEGGEWQEERFGCPTDACIRGDCNPIQ